MPTNYPTSNSGSGRGRMALLALIAGSFWTPLTSQGAIAVQGATSPYVAFQAETTGQLIAGTPENWVVKADATASAGGAIYADGTNSTADSPHSFAQFQVKFSKADTYYLYYRWRADAARTGGDAFTANSSWLHTGFGAFSTPGAAVQGDYVRTASNNAQAPADNDYAWTAESASYTVAVGDLASPLTLTLGSREAGMYFDRFVFSPDPALAAAALDALNDSETDVVIQGAGENFVAFEAEVKAHLIAGTPENWVVKADATASGGGAIYADGTNSTSDSPHSFAQFQIKFAKADSYTLYYRWRADEARTGGDAFTANSSWLRAGFGASSTPGAAAQVDYVRTASNNAQAPADNAYAWTPEASTYVVAAGDLAGPLVLTLGTREAGMFFDRFVLSPDSTLTSAALDALINSGVKPPTPEVSSAVGSAALNQVTIKFTRPIKSASALPAGFAFSPALKVTSAQVDPDDSRIVHLVTAAAIEGTVYTINITGVTDDKDTPVAVGTKAVFSAWKRVNGWATKEIFFTITGSTVAELTAAPNFVANKPDRFQWVKGFQLNQDPLTDNYGARLSTFFQPANNAVYDLFYNNDDEAELQLSTDTSVANLVSLGVFPLMAAFADAATVPTPSLTSSSRYLLVGLLKQGTGDAYLNVAARRQGDNAPVASLPVLGGDRISTFVNPDAGKVNFQKSPTNTTVAANARATFRVIAEAPGSPFYYQWQANGVDIPGAIRSSYTTPILATSDSGKKYRCVVSVAGIDNTSSEATLTVIPGDPSNQQPYLGINFVGGGTSGGASLSAVDVAGAVPQAGWNNLNGFTFDAAALKDASGTSTPVTLTEGQATELWYSGTIATGAADGALFQGFISAGTSKDPVTVTLNNVPAGKYNLLVYSMGFDFSAAYNTAFALAGGGIYPTYHGKSETGLPYQQAPAFRRMTSISDASPTSGNYVQFDNVTPAGDGSLAVSVTWESAEAGNSHQPAINAIQLVKIVEVVKPPVFAAPTLGVGGLTLTWTGGVAPFHVQFRGALTGPWSDLATVNDRTYTATSLGSAGFYRVVGSN